MDPCKNFDLSVELHVNGTKVGNEESVGDFLNGFPQARSAIIGLRVTVRYFWHVKLFERKALRTALNLTVELLLHRPLEKV